MEFNSPGEARRFYNEYSRAKGFSVLEAEFRILKRKGDGGSWYVGRFVEEHNHELLPGSWGASTRLNSQKKDMHNELRKQRELQSGDMHVAMRFFEGSKCLDENMFWMYETGVGGRMCRGDTSQSDIFSPPYSLYKDEDYNVPIPRLQY
ncbi:hypothetical protein PIB30_000713 [Stylosanthes scabra]|uniref:Protein FAR1-RELATED SEQUENCE n=1 Tax=Stylosanthes scabra TaxID=79078 RepID=A0ABU6Z196_9FABA|nr:hypothetical protein [Stylosanthes scabra]